jgi:hypothetical protein
MPRSSGFFMKMYENIVIFKLAFLGELKLYSQANFIYLVSSQIQVHLHLIFQAVNEDSVALTAGKIRCRST